MLIPKSKKYAKACVAVSLSTVMLFSTPSLAAAALRVGSTGSQVKEVQSQLKKLGYFKYPNITGYYGSVTQNAVRQFQASKGISQDGIVGKETRNYLFKENPGNNSLNVSATPVLRRGSRGASVKELQQILKNKGYYKEGNIDGSFGNQTYTAVLSFQRDAKIKVDGVAGPGTWAALLSGNTSSKGSTTSGGIGSVISLRKGERGTAVSDLQQRLKDLAYYSGKVDGKFGPATQRAVKDFQRAKGLSVDGIAGPKTLGLLKDLGSKGSSSTNDRGGSGSRPTPPAKNSGIDMIAWVNVDRLWPRGTYATVTDYETGKSFNVMRSGGTNHADVETATAKDTAIMKAIYGGKFSWDRRAIIVNVAGKNIAASMAGMPHAGRDDKPNRAMVSDRSCGYGYGQNLDAVKSNDMDGVFDVHFYKSRKHNNNEEDPKHQAQVKRAAGK